MKDASLKPAHFLFVTFSLAPLLWELPPTSLIAVVLMGLCVAIRPAHRFFHARRWLVQMMAVASGLFCLFYFGTLRSPDSTSTLVAMVTMLKLLDLRLPRDHMIFFMMNLLVAMFYGLYSQTLFSTFYLFTVYFIFIFSLLDLKKQELHLTYDPWNLRELFSLETVIALPLLVVLFLFFPRFTTSCGGLGSTEQTVAGFSSQMNPGQIQNIALSEEVAFRVEWSDGHPPASESLYFRGLVLEQQNGWSWSQRADEIFALPLQPSPLTHTDYEILLEPRFEKTIFTIEPTDTIYIASSDLAYTKNNYGVFQFRWPLNRKVKVQGQYATESLPLAPPLPLHLQVTPAPSKAVTSLIRRLKKEGDTPREHLQALMSFFKNNQFSYSLQTPKYDTLDEFLFEQKIGFCEHYAAAFATLARLLNVPSRVVIGYQGAELNTFGSYLLVRDKYAHAWTEVYLPESGWMRVDPTSSVAPARLTEGLFWESQNQAAKKSWTGQWLSSLLLFTDSVNHRYALFLMNYNLEQQFSLLALLGLGTWKIQHLLTLLLSLMAFLFIIAYLWTRKEKVSLDLTAKAHQLLIKKLSGVGLKIHPYEGPLDLQKKVNSSLLQEKEAIFQLIDRYIALRYQEVGDSSQARQLYRDIRHLIIRKS